MFRYRKARIEKKKRKIANILQNGPQTFAFLNFFLWTTTFVNSNKLYFRILKGVLRYRKNLNLQGKFENPRGTSSEYISTPRENISHPVRFRSEKIVPSKCEANRCRK